MGLPDIAFERVRPHDGSRNTGFEELCAQIASLEPAPPRSRFVRKGRGADAGIECFRTMPDGSEVGWQAKYLFGWNAGLVSQLNKSIRTALDKHPRLTEYVVCLPIDLTDARLGRGKTAVEKWEEWCERWKATASREGRTLGIKLWSRSELIGRLAVADGFHGGRTLYWFDVEALTPGWLTEQFAKAKAALGARYTPETNVELPIRKDFLAFSRDPSLQREIDGWFVQVSEERQSAVSAIERAVAGAHAAHAAPLNAALQTLANALGSHPIAPDEPYPLDVWRAATAQSLSFAIDALHWAYELRSAEQNGESNASRSYAETSLQRLITVLREVQEELASPRWRLTNTKAVLLTGPAGIGKSHLLADIVEHQIYEGCPAVFILGSSFRDDEPWRQILTQLDRPPTEQVKHFLGALDAAAEAAGTRALLCIDALNERNGLDIWPSRLAAFLETVKPFPRVAVILSCRSTYIQHVIPDSLPQDDLARVEHQGFAENGGEAAKVYLDKRGIVRPGAPCLVPEFENPLFLKTCCDSLEKDGRRELPRGLRGVTAIFGFYNEAVTRALTQRMGLDPHYAIVPRAISAFTEMLPNGGEQYLERSKTIALFESIRPSRGILEESLLSQLESEGLLTIEPVRMEDGSLVQLVRFTFERYSDHAIANRLLMDHLVEGDVVASFTPGKPLHQFVFGPRNYERAGVIEAIAIQLPESVELEILDVGDRGNWATQQAFANSLLWREQIYFTDRTFELARQRLNAHDLNGVLIAISTEPTNKFNALFVHRSLKAMLMPERDAWWSIYLANQGYEGEVKTLISWAVSNGLEEIDADRAYLTALMLTWFLTTSNRSVRDKATKALACILSRRLGIASRLVQEFTAVDDSYVFERLLAACYGAVLQGELEGLAELANTVFALIFAHRSPPTDVLLRDHARGIIEYANSRGVLSVDVDIRLARTPYSSAWPIEYVSNELIETYTETYPSGTFRDAIVGSTVNDGDFARYQMDYKVARWSSATRGTSPLPTARGVYDSWLKEFRRWASDRQQSAFKELLATTKSAKGIRNYENTPETERRDTAKARFKSLLTQEQWEGFRVRAEDFVLYQLYGEWRNSRPAVFDIGWARRWVCKRAHELGWTSALFSEFERTQPSHDRHDHEVERIGKKYQWMALRELLGRMADNLAYIADYSEHDSSGPVYQGAWQLGLRDIDPSLLTTETHYDGWAEWPKTWWVPCSPQLRTVSAHERLAWLDSDIDIVNDARLIDVTDPKTNRRWLALWGFSHWRCWGVTEGGKELQRDTWFRLVCVVVRKEDRARLVRSLQKRLLVDPQALPVIDLQDFYLGEYPWHPAIADMGEWSSPEDSCRSMPVPVRATVATYTSERGSYDYSIDKTVSVRIPAPWLAEALKLRMSSGRSPVYIDGSGRHVFFDPSVVEAGPAAALVDRDSFLQVLERDGLSAVWVIAGEKSVYGGRDPGRGFGGGTTHTAIYQLTTDGFTRQFHSEHEAPSEQQLAYFFGTEDATHSGRRAPSRAPTRTRARRRSGLG